MLSKLAAPLLILGLATGLATLGCSSDSGDDTSGKGGNGYAGGKGGGTAAGGTSGGAAGAPAGGSGGSAGTAAGGSSAGGHAGTGTGGTSAGGSNGGSSAGGSAGGSTGGSSAGGSTGGSSAGGSTGGSSAGGSGGSAVVVNANCTVTTNSGAPLTAAIFCENYLANCGAARTGYTNMGECVTSFMGVSATLQTCRSYHLCWGVEGQGAGPKDPVAHCPHTVGLNGVCAQ
jgi:hypothetical protein